MIVQSIPHLPPPPHTPTHLLSHNSATSIASYLHTCHSLACLVSVSHSVSHKLQGETRGGRGTGFGSGGGRTFEGNGLVGGCG